MPSILKALLLWFRKGICSLALDTELLEAEFVFYWSLKPQHPAQSLAYSWCLIHVGDRVNIERASRKRAEYQQLSWLRGQFHFFSILSQLFPTVGGLCAWESRPGRVAWKVWNVLNFNFFAESKWEKAHISLACNVFSSFSLRGIRHSDSWETLNLWPQQQFSTLVVCLRLLGTRGFKAFQLSGIPQAKRVWVLADGTCTNPPGDSNVCSHGAGESLSSSVLKQ